VVKERGSGGGGGGGTLPQDFRCNYFKLALQMAYFRFDGIRSATLDVTILGLHCQALKRNNSKAIKWIKLGNRVFIGDW